MDLKMPDINRLQIAGRLTRDPELKYSADGKPIAKFAVAVSRKVKSEEQTSFFNCVAFDKAAEYLASNVKKGMPVLCEGRMNQREWEKDGVKRRDFEVQCNSVQLLGWPETVKQDEQRVSGGNRVVDESEDIPF